MRLALHTLLAAGALVAAEPPLSYERHVQPFIAKHCLGCHNSKVKSGELNLERYQTAEAVVKDRDTWERVRLWRRSRQ